MLTYEEAMEKLFQLDQRSALLTEEERMEYERLCVLVMEIKTREFIEQRFRRSA